MRTPGAFLSAWKEGRCHAGGGASAAWASALFKTNLERVKAYNGPCVNQPG